MKTNQMREPREPYPVIMRASLEAGLAFSNARLGAVHAMSNNAVF